MVSITGFELAIIIHVINIYFKLWSLFYKSIVKYMHETTSIACTVYVADRGNS